MTQNIQVFRMSVRHMLVQDKKRNAIIILLLVRCYIHKHVHSMFVCSRQQMDQQQQQQQREENEGREEIAAHRDFRQEGLNLRWPGHRLQELNIAQSGRCDDIMGKLQSSGDREARNAMLGLILDLKGLNGKLAKHLARMSNANLGLVEMLEKSEDGRAALMMRKAADVLVKARRQRF